MGKVYNNLISTTAGFNYASQQPLDDREVVQSYADLAALVSSNASYDGMRVYVADDKKSYELVDGTWCAVATEEYVDQKLGGGVSVSEMTGASSEQDGAGGSVPAPKAGEDANFLRGDGTWDRVDAEDVWVNNETLLNFIPIILTQEEYNTLAGGGTITLNGQEISYEENRIYMVKKPVVDKEG